MTLRDHLRPGRLLLATMALLAAQSASAQTSLKFSLDGRLEGPASIFFVPQDKGYFAQEGLDVVVDEGATALEPISRVASGAYDFGFADINALIRYRDQHPGAPVMAVFMVYNRPPFSVVGRKSRGVTAPKSLEGKRLGVSTSGTTYPQWPLFAKLNDIDTSKVTIENIGIPVRVPMLAAGQIDAALGYSYRVYIDLKDRGVAVDDIVLMLMANHGVKLYGSTVIVNSKLAADKPQVVRAFLHAVLKGLKDTVRNPVAAVESVLKREDFTKKEIELERLRMVVRDNIVTPEVRMHGFGAVDSARLEEAIAQLALTYMFKARPKAEDAFDPTFLPPAAERRVN
jgi:NitT/TauT family transport system substrate-binding protein